MLKVENIRFGYVPSVDIFRDVTFTIEGGEYIAIGGRNGCGKTTITRLLVGLEKASEGRMYYNGTDITSMPPSKRGQFIGYVFQQPKQDRNFPLTELTEQQHREALENGFGKQVVQGYSNVIAALKQGYASIGYERGRNVLVSLNTFLVNKRMIVKEGKGYRYNPDFHY